jgi:hypothetical protein
MRSYGHTVNVDATRECLSRGSIDQMRASHKVAYLIVQFSEDVLPYLRAEAFLRRDTAGNFLFLLPGKANMRIRS